VKTKLIGYFSDGHGVGEILFVGQNEEGCVPKFVFSQNFLEFESSFIDTFAIIGINHENNSFSVIVIVPPECAYLVLTPNVPNGKARS
jgi:hypothetical protein